jgi:hypothetical protein
MVLNATFSNISVVSWRSVLLVEETKVHANRGHGVGIFTDPEKITVFPEFTYLKSPPECSGKVIIS